MKKPDYIPADYKRIKVVGSLSELFSEQFGGKDEVNCILYPRKLTGDFNALARGLENYVVPNGNDRHDFYTPDSFRHAAKECFLNPVAIEAAMRICADMEEISALSPSRLLCLRYVKEYTPSVYEFHNDGSGIFKNREWDRLLCSYNVAATEWIKNENWQESTKTAVSDACIFTFHPGDMFQQAMRKNKKSVPPFIHRAPLVPPDGPARLVLVVD